ncbi:MAG: hypothetical protein K2P94_07660 [Rhodospirillaceae bacterium]|nr:hypothetical protein [Rhodospirillaceae bacterium]
MGLTASPLNPHGNLATERKYGAPGYRLLQFSRMPVTAAFQGGHGVVTDRAHVGVNTGIGRNDQERRHHMAFFLLPAILITALFGSWSINEHQA